MKLVPMNKSSPVNLPEHIGDLMCVCVYCIYCACMLACMLRLAYPLPVGAVCVQITLYML